MVWGAVTFVKYVNKYVQNYQKKFSGWTLLFELRCDLIINYIGSSTILYYANHLTLCTAPFEHWTMENAPYKCQ